MTAPIDYNAVLADLLAKRGQIDAAIEVIRALIGAGSAAPEGAPNTEDGTGAVAMPGLVSIPGQIRPGMPPQTVQNDTFFRLSTAAAIKKYLGMMKRPQAPRAIADALQAGGQVHATDEKTAYTNVATALRRGKDKEFVQTRSGEWGLSEWYSNKPKGEGE